MAAFAGEVEHRLALVIATAGQHQIDPVQPGRGEPAHQARQVLALFPAADVEHIRPFQAMTAFGLFALAGSDRFVKPRVGCVGNTVIFASGRPSRPTRSPLACALPVMMRSARVCASHW